MKRTAKTVEYVCCGLKSNVCISRAIATNSMESAERIFQEETGVAATSIHGPFFRKRARPLDNQMSVVYVGKSFKGKYGGWHVMAIPLSGPGERVQLFFDRRVDEKKVVKPVGTIIVSKEEIKTE